MIIGTAGHIDHGKSALVRLLTGRSMDPLAEEQRRGITIDLHFAPLELGGGRVAGVVDVPGHEDLVRTMVAGAAGIDLVLLVVAADEGIMPQTREHLAVVEQLRIGAGIPVITKADLVEPAWLDLVRAEVDQWLEGSPVRFAAAIPTSSVSGSGLDPLLAAIRAAAAGIPPRDPDDLFRMPVDRAFSLPGAGTIVTGTVWSGTVRSGDTIRLIPAGPEGRVRSLERHGHAVADGAAGDRLAVAIAGVERSQAGRGSVLVRAGDHWESGNALDVLVELLPSAPRPLQHHARLRLHLGTEELLGRIRLRDPIPPGGRGRARVSLERPVAARGGDRFVLRSYSPVLTIGGGQVLDPLPPRGRPDWLPGLEEPEPAPRLAALAGRRPDGLALSLVPQVLGVSAGVGSAALGSAGLVGGQGRLVPAEAALRAGADLVAAVERHQRERPTEPGLPLEALRRRAGRQRTAGAVALARALETGQLVTEGAAVRTPGFRPAPGVADALVDRLVARLDSAGFTPPTVAELDAEMHLPGVEQALRLAVRAGRAVAVERDRIYSAGTLERFVGILRHAARSGVITPPDLRQATGASRKYLIPLLEWADREGLTRREGAGRVAGPRLDPEGGG